MADPLAITCKHIPTDLTPPTPSGDGCADCLAMGKRDWVHLRLCQTCGHVGCCDQSPSRHATAHYRKIRHPMVRSFEPGEDWWWCYDDGQGFQIEGAPPAPSHT
jgi:uncharacterized UBP type Zn finger protein